MQREDTDYLPDLRAAVRQKPRVTSSLLLFAVFFFFAFGGIWAYKAEIDVRTSGQGQVIPSRQLQIVQNLEGGILSRIYVREGATVKNGQLLLRLDDTQFASKFREDRTKYLGLRAVAARLIAEVKGGKLRVPRDVEKSIPNVAATEKQLFHARASELAASISVLEQQAAQKKQEQVELATQIKQLERSFALVEKEMEITKPLAERGIVGRVELIRLEREYNDIQGALESSRQKVPRAESAVVEIERKIVELRANFKSRALKELNEAQVNIKALKETLASMGDRVRRTEIRAPVEGVIKRILVNTLGGVVRPGMDLVEIVPLDDDLLVEARIKPSDIAFLHPGQEAKVKITAYDYSIYGSLPARLEHISADTILDKDNNSYYLIRVRTDRNNLGDGEKTLPIIPGMTAEVDILTGKRTVMEYILKPFRRVREKALRER